MNIPPAVTLYWQEERIKELEGMLDELRARVAGLEGRVRGYREMLEHYGQHSYPCASEHGRYPKRCTCGLREALG